MAIAQLLTVLPEPAGRTLLVAQLARPSGRARALTVDGIANAPVLAVALLGTVPPIVLRIARPIALDALPARCTGTLARFTVAGRPVHALAPLATVLAVRVVRAGLLAAFALEAGNAKARAYG